MATLEVGYELKDTVDFLVASQDSEPDDGMPYDDYLKWMTKYPEAPAVSVAKNMVDAYVKSYAPRGSQGSGRYRSETKSAIRLARTPALRDAVEQLAGALAADRDLLAKINDELMLDIRHWGRAVDPWDLCDHLTKYKLAPKPVKDAAKKVLATLDYPSTGTAKMISEIVVRPRKKGEVVWGWNAWKPVPRSLAPFLSKSRFARTPLVGPDPKGYYSARLRFPAMLEDPKTKKRETVTEINYYFNDDPRKRTSKDFVDTWLTMDFRSESPLCAEGHHRGSRNAHGVSLYLPSYLGLNKLRQ